MQMNTTLVRKAAFTISGVSARTTNEAEAGPNGLLPQLWQTYFQNQERLLAGSVDEQPLYALYTDYERDANGAYTVILGHGAEEEDKEQSQTQGEGWANVEGIQVAAAAVPASLYRVFTSPRGPVPEVVLQTWMQIWEYYRTSEEKRAYTGDFELYEAGGLDPTQTVVQIYIAVK